MENYAKNLTLRYPIRPMFDGDSIKITLDNFCGTEPVTITRVFVADVLCINLQGIFLSAAKASTKKTLRDYMIYGDYYNMKPNTLQLGLSL